MSSSSIQTITQFKSHLGITEPADEAIRILWFNTNRRKFGLPTKRAPHGYTSTLQTSAAEQAIDEASTIKPDHLFASVYQGNPDRSRRSTYDTHVVNNGSTEAVVTIVYDDARPASQIVVFTTEAGARELMKQQARGAILTNGFGYLVGNLTKSTELLVRPGKTCNTMQPSVMRGQKEMMWPQSYDQVPTKHHVVE